MDNDNDVVIERSAQDGLSDSERLRSIRERILAFNAAFETDGTEVVDVVQRDATDAK